MIYLLAHPVRRRGQSLWRDYAPTGGAWWTTDGWKPTNDRSWSRQSIRGPVAMPMSEVRAACAAADEPMELWCMGSEIQQDDSPNKPTMIWSEAGEPKPGLFAFAEK